MTPYTMYLDIQGIIYEDEMNRNRLMHTDELHNQNRRDLPRDILQDSVVVLRYKKRSESENKGKVLNEMELVLEQTQQGNHSEDGNLLKPTSNKHMSILTDSKIYVKMEWRYLVLAAAQDKSRFIATCSYSTDKCKDIMKAQVHVSRLLLL
ncbi:hypothetical protein Tco_0702337 [Tanacetum coccineum]|uniref:Uncharacterized protein n=1 Tax=Tanacetum coccineum TaxID=301880 RepID=A0ABQ4XXA6_9ASTR